MKALLLLMMSCAANASINCYTYGTITSCGNQVSIYKFGNMSQVVTPQGNTTIYNYENGSTVILPKNPVPTFYPHLQKFDTPLLTPALGSPVLD